MDANQLIQDLTRRFDLAIAELTLAKAQTPDRLEKEQIGAKTKGLLIAKGMLESYIEETVEEVPVEKPQPLADCLASLYDGIPMYIGAHKAHWFYYGPGEKYTGHCGGRGESLEVAQT